MISGASFLTGYDMDDHPQRTALPDPISGAFGAFATLMALEIRDLVGSGQYIDVSQTEALATLIGQQVIEYQLTGQTPVRIANRHLVYAPHNLYPCEGEDNWVAIAVTTDDEWASLARLLGKTEWTQDARFATAAARKQVEDEIDEVISEWTRDKNKRAAMELLQSRGIPSGAVQRGSDLLTDPHLRARNYFTKLPREYIGDHEYPETPWHFSDTVCEHRFAAPTLGQHTDEVLREFGITPEEIEKLREEKVI